MKYESEKTQSNSLNERFYKVLTESHNSLPCLKVVRGVGCPVEFYGLTRVKRKFSHVHTDCRQDQVGLPEFYVRRTSEFPHPRLIFLPTILNRSNSIDILGDNVTFLRMHVSPQGRRRHYACQVVREQWCELTSEISSIL